MSIYTLPYGAQSVEISLPDMLPVDVLRPANIPGTLDPVRIVEEAIAQPVGKTVDFHSFGSAAIAVNDKTRPVPHDIILPPLLDKLEQAGMDPSRITLIIATGTHIPMPKEEFRRVLPDSILNRYQVVTHDAGDDTNLISLGISQRGTPIQINRKYYEADLRIVVGNIEPHHFMGFSGGVKSAVIGLGGRATINHNHAMLTHPMARTAIYVENPMRQDIEEIGQTIGIQFAVNAILNQSKDILEVIAGEPRAVIEAGIPKSRAICQVQVKRKYDLVIASAGGYPKDINFYQAQKALTHAAMITRDGGTVVLIAACTEGIGSAAYARWIDGMVSHSHVIERFHQEGFQVGPHKAFMVARDAIRIKVILVSQMEASCVRQLLLTPASSAFQAIEQAIQSLPVDPHVAVLPAAVATIPYLVV